MPRGGCGFYEAILTPPKVFIILYVIIILLPLNLPCHPFMCMALNKYLRVVMCMIIIIDATTTTSPICSHLL